MLLTVNLQILCKKKIYLTYLTNDFIEYDKITNFKFEWFMKVTGNQQNINLIVFRCTTNFFEFLTNLNDRDYRVFVDLWPQNFLLNPETLVINYNLIGYNFWVVHINCTRLYFCVYFILNIYYPMRTNISQRPTDLK